MEPAEGARRPRVLQPGEAALHDTAEAWRRGSVRKRKAPGETRRTESESTSSRVL